jgi:lysophospholipid acyltransferase (LPLAT)-like uncharacterized protein
MTAKSLFSDILPINPLNSKIWRDRSRQITDSKRSGKKIGGRGVLNSSAIIATGSHREIETFAAQPGQHQRRYNNSVSSAATAPAKPAANDLPYFTPWQRLQLWAITWIGTLIIRIIGPTLRVSVSIEDGGPPSMTTRPLIYSFWHDCIFASTYIWRDLRVRVMSSDSFDGEWMGRIIRKFGFVKIRGSKSKGAVRALLAFRKEVENGWVVAFTIDGPRGPRYVAKPGPVVVARATGVPMVVYHIGIDRGWVLPTWDKSILPKPFSKALLRISRLMPVSPDADEVEKQRMHAELQAALERVRDFAVANVSKVGTEEFPLCARK